MATLFDGGLLASFGSVFAFLFVYVLVYGLLTKIKIFGEAKEGLNAIIALCAAVFTMFSPMVVSMITYMIPWLIILLVVGLMIFVFSEYMGMKIQAKRGGPGETVVITIMIIVLIIFLVAFSKFYNPNQGQSSTQIVYTSQSVTVTDENGTQINTTSLVASDNRPDWMKTLFSPKVLGLMLILVIGAFAIQNLGDNTPKA
jgi:hypothetical protein